MDLLRTSRVTSMTWERDPKRINSPLQPRPWLVMPGGSPLILRTSKSQYSEKSPNFVFHDHGYAENISRIREIGLGIDSDNEAEPENIPEPAST